MWRSHSFLAAERGVSDSIECEMLEGMAPAHARVVQNDASGLLLYTPAVAAADFDVAISYLFRRSGGERHRRELHPPAVRDGRREAPSMQLEAARFRASLRDRWSVGDGAATHPTTRNGEPPRRSSRSPMSLTPTRRWPPTGHGHGT